MSGPKRILIVEDEPLIAMMLEDFLECLDKEVAGTADSVETALPLLAQADAAILDVNLRGGEKSEAVAAALVDLGKPFIFATGGGADSVAEPFRDRPRLQKPFTMDGVAKALSQL